MEFHVVIPARLASSRLPEKVLLDIAGRPMLQHVYEAAVASGADSVTVATDDEQVARIAEKFGADVVMTSSVHRSGTERISEALEAMDLDEESIIIGLQSDEPLMPPLVIRQLAEALEEHDTVRVVSACHPIYSVEELQTPGVVKVLMNRRHFAMTFTRSIVPWQPALVNSHSKIQLEHHYYRHVGVYGYRAGFLKDFMDWPDCPFAELESLEQLRILWNGGRIFMVISVQSIPAGVDTPADLDRVRSLF